MHCAWEVPKVACMTVCAFVTTIITNQTYSSSHAFLNITHNVMNLPIIVGQHTCSSV